MRKRKPSLLSRLPLENPQSSVPSHTRTLSLMPTMFSQHFHSWMFIAITSAILLLICSPVRSFPEADKVKTLPGQPPVTFQQFAGYVTVDEKKQRSLFYYFVEAETNAASKPIVLWLNGGPGCSSIGVGAFTENGPFTTNYGKSIVKNNFSWNKEASILYLDSPAGVGFSYSLNNSFYGTLNDEVTARDSFVFLQRWFDKFPEYKNKDFYITGESYAGHYAPQLAELIVKSKSKVQFNLKGIAIGNPLLDMDIDVNSVEEYYWSHGIISESAYKTRISLCNSSRLNRELIGGQISLDCLLAINRVADEYSFISAIDPYYIIGDKCVSYNLSQANFLSELLNLRLSKFIQNQNLQQTNELDQQLGSCNQQNSELYLNRKDVQKALHAQLLGAKTYRLCSSNVLSYYEASDRLTPTIDVVGFLVRSGLRVIVYSGDLDAVVPFIGSRRLVDGLAKKLRLKTTVPYSAWFVGKQVGGWTQVYGDKLTYATIRGGSHGAPTTQPERSFVLFTSFLNGKPLPEA